MYNIVFLMINVRCSKHVEDKKKSNNTLIWKVHFVEFNVQGSVHHKYVPFDTFPTRCNITQFIYFWKSALHVSCGISTHHQQYTQLYLQCLVHVKPLLLPAALWKSWSWFVFTLVSFFYLFVINKFNLEFGHPRCVCNNEVKYNEGQNTTKFIS